MRRIVIVNLSFLPERYPTAASDANLGSVSV
jgi:hypothetical protein